MSDEPNIIQAYHHNPTLTQLFSVNDYVQKGYIINQLLVRIIIIQLSQATIYPSVPTAVGKCKISMFNIVVLLFSGLVIMLNV